MKLALHRSVTFWTGILTIAFLAWAWRDSTQRWGYAQMARTAFSNLGSGLMVKHEPTLASTWYVHTSDITTNPRYSVPFGAMRLPRPLFFRPLDPANLKEFYDKGTVQGQVPDPIAAMNYWVWSEPRAWVLFIPHWLLVLAVFLLWSGLLFWRSKRGRLPQPA